MNYKMWEKKSVTFELAYLSLGLSILKWITISFSLTLSNDLLSYINLRKEKILYKVLDFCEICGFIFILDSTKSSHIAK